jgi:hypothetical protein
MNRDDLITTLIDGTADRILAVPRLNRAVLRAQLQLLVNAIGAEYELEALEEAGWRALDRRAEREGESDR